MKPPYNGRARLPKLQYDAAVSEPTPDGHWFTPRAGWPDAEFAGGRPENLMPTEAHAPDFFIPGSKAIGELRVELLETDALPKMDLLLDQNDVYALLVFEDSIACTEVIWNVDSPRWHSECARAFRFPIHAPHSSVHVALFDSDHDSGIPSHNTNTTALVRPRGTPRASPLTQHHPTPQP